MSRRNSRSFIVAGLLVALLAVPALASGPIIFANQENILMRIKGQQVDVFQLDQVVTSLAFDEQGVLWATDPDDPNQNNKFEIYKINDPFGTPSVELVSDGLSRNTASIDWYQNTLYGSQSLTPDPGTVLVTIDPQTGQETRIGATGATNVNRIGGIAIDATTLAMYALDNDPSDSVYSLDWRLLGGPDPTGTLIGPTGVAVNKSGLDFFEPNNTLYAMIRTDNEEIGVYTIDTGTGAASLLIDLSSITSARGATGIAVIPEPGTLSVLLLGAGLLRRR